MHEILKLLQPPFHEPVIVIALAMVVFFAAPIVFRRLRLPVTVALILAGAALGPNGSGLLARDDTIVLLGTVGLLYLMFIAAIEIDLHDFLRNRNRSLVFGVLGFAAPLVLGTFVGRYFGYGVAAAILLGAMLSSHTLLAYPTASRMGIAKNQAVMVAVGATIITDLLALLMLAGISASAEGNFTVAFWGRFVVSVSIFLAVVFKALPAFASWFLSHSESDGVAEYTFVLASLFVSAALAQLAGLEPIIGAFLAGLALNQFLPESQPLANRLTFVADAIFTPFFLLSVGMLVDVGALAAGAKTVLVLVGMIVTVLPAKFIAAWVTRRVFGYSREETWVMFGLSVPQAAATLAIALIGYRLKLFDTALLNATIIVILTTSTLGPWLVERYGRKVALNEQRRPFRPITSPQRILIPVSDTQSSETLVDFSLLLRTPGSKEPLLPIAVVSGLRAKIAARVAAAEKMLGHAVMYATGAGVSAIPLTRVARAFAAGVLRGITESRATTIVTGWNGTRSRRSAVLNEELDELIAQTRQLVLVTRLAGTVNTVNRVIMIIPRAANRSAGFNDAVRVVKLVTSRLSGRLHVYVVGTSTDEYHADLKRTRPHVPIDVRQFPDWNALTQELEATTRTTDLVMMVGERRGMVAWEREIDQMPARISQFAEKLCVMYPCTLEPAEADGDHLLTLLTEALRADRVTAGLGSLSMETAIEEMLKAEFPEGSARLREAVTSVERGLVDCSQELKPGVFLITAHVEELAAPLLFIATSRSGIRLPRRDGIARLLAIIVAPSGHAKTAKEYGEELLPLVHDAQRIDQLCACTTAECIAALFRSEPGSAHGPLGDAA